MASVTPTAVLLPLLAVLMTWAVAAMDQVGASAPIHVNTLTQPPSAREAAEKLASSPPLMEHSPITAARLNPSSAQDSISRSVKYPPSPPPWKPLTLQPPSVTASPSFSK